MRDISKKLTVINTGNKESEAGAASQPSGVVYVGAGGGGGVGTLKDYLLKSIWDRVWEIRTDSQGTEYIFGKLPVVTQYGITMYSGENMDIPTIAEGLPFDNRTIWFNPTTKQIEVIGGTGGGSGEGVSNFWDLNGIPSWITNTKPTYSYSEIQGTPDLSKYALASDIPSLSGYAKLTDIPSLSGYATEQWVLDKGYALSSDLSKYIPIAGATDITGEKNFVGGLKVNGSPIYYDTEKKYWKLEGDLLVTGGVTMYGNDSEFVASTIMDAIVVDGTTISKEGGVLKVIGSVGGATTLGGLANVGSWADSVASQDRIMYQAANSSQWVAKNLSDLAVGGVTGNYLPLSGGTLSDGLTINQTTRTALVLNEPNGGMPVISFQKSGSTKGGIRLNDSNYLESLNMNKYQWELLLTSDNYSSYALPLSGGTLTSTTYNVLTINSSYVENGNYYSRYNVQHNGVNKALFGWNNSQGAVMYNYTGNVTIGIKDDGTPHVNGSNIWHAGNDGGGSGLDADLLDGKHYSDIINGNVASATRLQAYQYNSGEYTLISGTRTDKTFPRSIYDNGWALCVKWQDSNGVVHDGYIASLNDNVASATKLQTARTIWGQSFDGTGNVSGDFIAHFVKIYDDNVIEATSNKKLHLNYYATTDMSLCYGGGKVGIGNTNPAYNLDIVGNSRSSVMFFWNKDWNGNAGYIGRGSTSVDRIILYAGKDDVYIYSKGVISTIFTGADMLVQGGITMYSARKLKNIQDERGLSLEELSVIKPTRFTWKDGRDNKIHIGGIADDVQKVLPEVIYKADNDTLTMDYGNAAFAIAASIIKPVVNHEERIRLLEEENKRLKEEVEQLKWNIA